MPGVAWEPRIGSPPSHGPLCWRCWFLVLPTPPSRSLTSLAASWKPSLPTPTGPTSPCLGSPLPRQRLFSRQLAGGPRVLRCCLGFPGSPSAAQLRGGFLRHERARSLESQGRGLSLSPLVWHLLGIWQGADPPLAWQPPSEAGGAVPSVLGALSPLGSFLRAWHLVLRKQPTELAFVGPVGSGFYR